MNQTPKIFGIGFHKTGTTSLAHALRILGYRVTGPDGVNDPDIAQNVHSMVRKLVPQYDAFQDNPWPILFRELDALYPGSRFILTIRDSDSWMESQLRHFGRRVTPMREWIYGVGNGCPSGNENLYLSRYEQHNAAVLDYFKDRPTDLLVMSFAKGDGWEKLCPFLGRPVPRESFPHANKAGDRESSQRSPTVGLANSLKRVAKHVRMRIS